MSNIISVGMSCCNQSIQYTRTHMECALRQCRSLTSTRAARQNIQSDRIDGTNL